MKTKSFYVWRLILIITLAGVFIGFKTIITTPADVGKILKVQRSDAPGEIRAIIFTDKMRIKLFFVKRIPYESPARIDVIAKDIDGYPVPLVNQRILDAIPNDVYKKHHLPYLH